MKKRGRKAGSVSFCNVSLEELNRVLKPGARVVVSIKYAEMIGLHGSKIQATPSLISSMADNIKVDVHVEQFDGCDLIDQNED